MKIVDEKNPRGIAERLNYTLGYPVDKNVLYNKLFAMEFLRLRLTELLNINAVAHVLILFFNIRNKNTLRANTIRARIQLPGSVEKKVKFDLNQNILKTRVKITYTENGIEKILYCYLSKKFRLFSSEHGKIEENITAKLENVELF